MKIPSAIARFILLAYPPSFRREMSEALIGDVRRRAIERRRTRGPLRFVLWLVRLTLSLVINAVCAWAERIADLLPGRRATPATPRASAFSWIDIKLACRMLLRYPGLTITGGLGIAVAVAIGVGGFALFYSRFYPSVPLPDGDRLVGLENWNRRTHTVDRRALYDYGVWRTEMKSVEDLTAFADTSRNVTAPDGSVSVARVSEITPSGFRLARVPPLMGRTLIDDDAAPGASPVIVIGADVWRTRLASDPDVVGRQLKIGDAMHTIVGVMPDGFAFPVNHQYWMALRYAGSEDPASTRRDPASERRNAAAEDRREVFVAGRLAPGLSLDDANAEIATIGKRLAAALPDTHEQLRSEVLPYTYPFAGMNASSSSAFWPVSILFALILIVVAVNVAILIYARTATRVGELAVRSALGASRARLVGQLFVESLLLSAVASAAGLAIVSVLLGWARASLTRLSQSHFWADYTLSGEAVVYCTVLAAMAAVITGVIPALRATRRQVQLDLRPLSSGAGLRLGRTWTTLIVVQVSVAAAALPIAVGLGWFQVRDMFILPRFPVDRILFADVGFDRAALRGQGQAYWTTLGVDFSRLRSELSRRLTAESSALDHSFTLGLPTIGRSARVEIEDDPGDATGSRQVEPSTVDERYFRTFGVEVLAGRSFTAADCDGSAADAVIVNRAFVNRLLAGGNALGRRIRVVSDGPTGAVDESAPVKYSTIVGVVENIDTNPFGDDLSEARVYQPLKNWERRSVSLAVRTAPSERGALARKLPVLAATLDPELQITVGPFEDLYRIQRVGLTTAAAALGVALLSVILLSAAGIYALTSFTITQRRREIAIRAALGAQPHRLLGVVFSGAMRQVSVGLAIGVSIAWLIDYSQDGEALAGHAASILPAMMVVMSLVAIAAAVGPARRGLRIEPVDALRGE